MTTLTSEDLAFMECACLKANNVALLNKILEIKDYVYFHRLDGITLDIDWRKDREEENE